MKAEYHRLKSWADRIKAGEGIEKIAPEMSRFLRDIDRKQTRSGLCGGIDGFLKQLRGDVNQAMHNLDFYESEGYAHWQEKLTRDAVNAMIENVKMQTSDDQKKTNCAIFEASIRPLLIAKQAENEAEAMAVIAEIANMAFKQLLETKTRKI